MTIELPKLKLLAEAEKPDAKAAILAAIDAVMVRHATILSLEVDREEVMFEVNYEFPEHRTGLPAAAKAALKGVAKVSSEKHGSMREMMFVLSFHFDLAESIDHLDVEEAIRKKFKGRIER